MFNWSPRGCLWSGETISSPDPRLARFILLSNNSAIQGKCLMDFLRIFCLYPDCFTKGGTELNYTRPAMIVAQALSQASL